MWIVYLPYLGQIFCYSCSYFHFVLSFSRRLSLMAILPTIMKVINLNLNNKTTYYKASRDVSSAESGSATPLFEDEDDLYDPLDSLDCSVPDIEPSSLHPDHSSVFLSPPHSDPTFLSPSDTVSVACRRSSIICVRKGRGQESHHQQGRNDLPQLSS